MSTVRMYELIKKTSLPPEEAEALVNEIEALVNQRFDDRKEHLATKEDVANAKTELTRSIADVETKLTTRIYVASAIASSIQILGTLGGLFGILKFMQLL